MNFTSVSVVRINALLLYGKGAFIRSAVVNLLSKSNLNPIAMKPSCVQNVPSTLFSGNCINGPTPYAYVSNNTLSVIATNTLFLNSTSLRASLIVLCSLNIFVDYNASISSTGLGCGGEDGLGAGEVGYGTSGGGGGGYGGAGGCGYNSAGTGGASCVVSSTYSAGSGGGGYSSSLQYFSAAESNRTGDAPSNTTYRGGIGGGIVVLIATNLVSVYGRIGSSGISGQDNSGGGAGGTIVINAGSLMGAGTMLSMGGNGGGGSYPGGGGGGGVVTLFNPSGDYVSGTSQTFGFAGTINSEGGTAMSGAQGGSTGTVSLPVCPAGYGNSATSGGVCLAPCSMCTQCLAGYYNTGGNSNPCMQCTNAPLHSYYSTSGSTSSNCPYDCQTSYSTLQCYSYFDNFLYNQITVGGFSALLIGIFMLLVVPLSYYRLKFRYGWFQSKKKKKDHFFDFFFKENVPDIFGIQDEVGSKRLPNDVASGVVTRNNPISVLREGTKETSPESNIRSIPATLNIVELRKAYRLSDQDMQFHACRVNLLGSNSPFGYRGNVNDGGNERLSEWISGFSCPGGSWILPPIRPACLKPTLLKAEYREFAESINAAVMWRFWSWETISFILTALVAPPLASVLMVRRYTSS
jgi:hypothetical protein